ncbi:hypothetical protein [Metabacillus niabensis]|uniref:Uncharacterized protein n=1 Tax=Metabacillus niabensis TaxID=324854 RepID=A0ABT9YXQ3_9BACI|nr:hypothetical protein [Metabacillus niabensis]MDQ0224118.1 hypothetical protein [Metabacillus niabensis]PAD70351.1 hypothetical protein CHH83_03245 [Bacillus sp. 7586-K]
MGYILPIQQDTYTQYVNRTVQVQRHYAYTTPTVAIPFIGKHQKEELVQKKKHFAMILEEKMKKLEKVKQLEAELGKGKHINTVG